MAKIFIACLVLLVIMTPAYPAFAETVSATDLINNAGKYANTAVELRGEAIGDVMKRGSHGWINVSDGSNAIGVWASVEMLDKIRTAGDYKHTGDIIVVKGTFNQVCNEHGGDLDIHATSITVSKVGSKRVHTVNDIKLYAAESLVLVAAVLYFINRKKQNRRNSA